MFLRLGFDAVASPDGYAVCCEEDHGAEGDAAAEEGERRQWECECESASPEETGCCYGRA
jgi:hypothetical protein